MSAEFSASENGNDAFAAVSGVIALIADPKGAAARLKELRGVLVETERASAKFAADKQAAEIELAQRRAAFDAEIAQRRAEVERSEEAYRTLISQAETRERQFSSKIAEADRVLDRFNTYWKTRLQAEFGPGAAKIMATPSFWRDDPLPEPDRDRHFATAADGSFDVASAERVRIGAVGEEFPAVVSLTRQRPLRRGAED
jgi:hypothetical protein